MAAAELTKTVLKDNANLKAYYRFTAGSLLVDSSGNNNTLTNTTAVTEGTGKHDGGAAFDGSHYLNIASNAGINPTGTTPFSVGCWFQTTSTSEKGIISKGLNSGSTIQWGLHINSAETIAFYTNNNGAWGTAQTTLSKTGWTIGTNTWYHIVGTYDGTTMRLYLNGVHEVSSAAPGVVNKTGDLYIGSFYNTSGYKLSGLVDDAFLLNGTALSADQIKELYEGRFIGESYPQAGLVAGWHLNGGSTDFSGNNNHGTDTAITYSQANGKFGRGADFNGSTGFIQLPNISATLGTLSAFSISFWLNADNKDYGAGEGKVIDIRGSGTGYIIFRVTSINFNWYLYNGTEAQFNYARVVGSWVHIAYVYDGSNLIGYLNGNRVGSASRTGTVATGVSGCFGREYNASAAAQYDGKLDEVLIFNRALTPQEIRRMYALGVGKLY